MVVCHSLVFHEAGKALVQPQIVPPGQGHQVSKPSINQRKYKFSYSSFYGVKVWSANKLMFHFISQQGSNCHLQSYSIINNARFVPWLTHDLILSESGRASSYPSFFNLKPESPLFLQLLPSYLQWSDFILKWAFTDKYSSWKINIFSNFEIIWSYWCANSWLMTVATRCWLDEELSRESNSKFVSR